MTETVWGKSVVEEVVQEGSGPADPCAMEGHDFTQILVESSASGKAVPIIWTVETDQKDGNGHSLVSYTRVFCQRCAMDTTIIAADRRTPM